MKTYYIYKQTTKRVEIHVNYDLYKWLPFDCIGYVTGTRELYDIFKTKLLSPFTVRRPVFCNAFPVHDEYFKKYEAVPYWGPNERFLITDEKGHIRDFYELTRQYKKPYTPRHHSPAWRCHYANNLADVRHDITPQEARAYKYEYGICIKTVKTKTSDTYYGSCRGISRGWKEQSKRKRQYKEKGQATACPDFFL